MSYLDKNLFLPPEYVWQRGSSRDRLQLVKFMTLAYQELFPTQANFSHLTDTVKTYLVKQNPGLWWIKTVKSGECVACLWLGNAISQKTGERYTHIFLIYVIPTYRRQGLGTAMLKMAQTWAIEQGQKQIGLQVFVNNFPAVNLYKKFGFESQSILMIKNLP